jgi:ABC-type transport system involved in cytochrome bd biosynthesis fused ATPase/permease subunit
MNTLPRLLRLITPYKGWVALAVLLSFLTIGSSVGLMAMSAYLISRSALVSDVSVVAIPITLVRVFAVLRAIFRYLERYFTHRATFRILTHLRVWFYAAVEPLAPARLMAYRSGDLLARIVGDIETLENFYVRVVMPPLSAVLVTVLACLILGSFDASLAAALLVFLALTGIALPLASRWLSRQPAAALIATRAEINATLVDEIQGLADVLSFDQAGRYEQRLLALSGELEAIQGRMAMVRGLSNGLAVLLTSLAGLTVLGLAIPLVSGGQIDGVFLALLPLTAIALPALRRCSRCRWRCSSSRRTRRPPGGCLRSSTPALNPRPAGGMRGYPVWHPHPSPRHLRRPRPSGPPTRGRE